MQQADLTDAIERQETPFPQKGLRQDSLIIQSAIGESRIALESMKCPCSLGLAQDPEMPLSLMFPTEALDLCRLAYWLKSFQLPRIGEPWNEQGGE